MFRGAVVAGSPTKVRRKGVFAEGGGGDFASEYALDRALITNNPGSLVASDDWSSYADTAALCQEFNNGQGWNDPCVAGNVELASDPIFGNVAKGFHRDGSDANHPHTVRYGKSFTGISKGWYRVLYKDGPNFNNNSAWKFFWGSHRHMEMVTDDGFVLNYNPGYGGTEGSLANSPAPGSAPYMGFPSTMPVDEEWWEIIGYEERVSSTHYRRRLWMRPITTGDGTVEAADVPGQPGDYTRKVGHESTGATVPTGQTDGINLGVNRNDPMPAGTENTWFWGPWEVIDGDVISDPYNLANDML